MDKPIWSVRITLLKNGKLYGQEEISLGTNEAFADRKIDEIRKLAKNLD